MSSRKTSDEGDRIATQLDNFRDGKNTTWKGDEPALTLDYNDAANTMARYLASGDKRFLDIIRNMGGRVAKGDASRYNGMITGRDIGTDYGVSTTMEGARFAALVTKDSEGITIWILEMCSADAFQWANRGGNGGKTDDSNDNYVIGEDPRNKMYSIAVYTPKGKIPKEKVYEAFNAGLLERDFAEEFFKFSPIYQIEAARDRAKAEQAKREAQKIIDASKPKPLIGSNTIELSVTADGSRIGVAKTSQESMAISFHPGVAVAGVDWESISEGKTLAELGLPGYLVAYQPDGTIRPATAEYKSVRAAAEQEAYANEALLYIGFGFPNGPREGQGGFGGFWDEIGGMF